jgi:hypothetical protein
MRGLLILIGVVLGGPTAALDLCDELWFTRNLVFDRAGYCFGSPLGKAIFDNSDCIINDAVADPAAQRIVDQVLAIEADEACRINTGRTGLKVPFIEHRMRMVDIPVPDIYESMCIGWRGAPLTLHTARNDKSPVTGIINTGEDILWSFYSVDGWSFITSPRGDADMGWMRDVPMNEGSCDGFAG